MKTLYVLDASGYLYRSYFAIRGMSNAKGESTNALFGFIRSVQKLFKDFQPDHFVAVFDGPRGTEKRKALYQDYKAQRAKMPDDLRDQIQWAKHYCDLAGLPKLDIEGVEADDTMASVATWAKETGSDVYLCTSDKDLNQLVNSHVFILNTHKDNLIMGEAQVKEAFGVSPKQIVDYLALCGDASDNVPGVPGIGPKTASALLQEHQTLEKLLSLPNGLTPKQQQAFQENQELAALSKKLVTVDTSVSIPTEAGFYQTKTPDINGLKQLFTTMSFNSLLKDLGSDRTKSEEVEYNLVNTEQQLDQVIALLKKQTTLCFDTETTDIHPMRAEIVGVGIGFKPRQAWYIPFNGAFSKEKLTRTLKELFEDPSISFFGHNVKYDWHVLKQIGIEVKNISFDTILASYLLHSHSRQHSLDHLALTHFGKVKTPITDLIGKGKNAITMRQVPLEKVAEYCSEDVDYTIRLKEVLEKELETRNLNQLYHDMELPLCLVLAKMEETGIGIDPEVLKRQGLEIEKQIRQLQEEIYQIAGEPFNLNSPKQVSALLFEKMGIRPPKKTATGYSTNAEVLEELKGDYPICAKLLEYRMIEKLRSTYIETLPQQILKLTKRIHPTFNQSVAATGRLSCQDPNLQNIPIRTDAGRRIREAFRPDKETSSFLSADYSQIELRLLAHFSEEPNLLNAFHQNEDVHKFTAALVFGVPVESVTKEQRQQAKAVNFGIIYGQGPFGLSKELGIKVDEAKQFIEAYFKQYPKVKEYIESAKEEARRTSKAVTLFKREREIPEIHSKNPQLRSFAERLAVNTPLQGTAADLIKLAMIQLDKALRETPSLGKMILQIHDELIFEVPDTAIESLQAIVKREMENVIPLKVPLLVDISVGKNWKEC